MSTHPQNHSRSASRSNPSAAAFFYLICLLLLPFILAGYVLWIIHSYTGRKSSVSRTAQGPLSARWFQHQIGTRADDAASRLLMVLPGVSTLALRLVFGPLLLAHRLSGFVPAAFRYPFEGEVTLQNQASARQTIYDSVVERHLAPGTQFVILGAGFDTRAYRLPETLRVPCFEVDTATTIDLKRDLLAKAGIDTTGCTFVAADFEQQDWLSRLVEAGFDSSQPALFLWEGVTPYLQREAVEDTLRKIAGSARGSLVAFDYLTSEVLESQSPYLRLVRASLRAGGEPLTFGIDSTPPVSQRIAELLRSCGLSLDEQRTLGQETNGKRAWGGFVVARVE